MKKAAAPRRSLCQPPAVSSSSIFQELQSFYQSRQADLKQLGNALHNGDLSGAQQAYNSLAVLGEGGPFSNSEPFGRSNRAQAFDAVGEALQAGDLSRAQASFATLTAAQSKTTTSVTPAAVVNITTQPVTTPPVSSSSPIYQQLHAYQQARTADIAQLGKDLKAGDLKAAQQDFNTLTALGQSGPNKNGLAFQQTNRAQDIQAIGQALQAGNLAGAQAAFASLQTDLGKQNQQAQTAISAYTRVVAEIVINFGAPQASSTGSSILTPAPPIEPPVSEAASTGTTSTNSATPELIINLGAASNPTASSGTPELVINLEAASSSNASSGSAGPGIVINVGQGSNSSPASAEEITINFGSGGGTGPQVSIAAAPGQNGSSADQITIDLNQQNTNNYQLILSLFNPAVADGAQNSSSAFSVSA
jgi:hypothetical protein